MNWVDLVIISVVLVFALEGLRRGFFLQLLDIIGFLVSLLISLSLYPQAALLLTNIFNLQKIIAIPIGFLVIWLTTETIFFTLFGTLFNKFLAKFAKNKVNRYFGFIPAALNSLLFISFLLLFVVSLPIKGEIKQEIFAAKFAPLLIDKVSVLERPLANVFGPIAKQSLTFLTVKPEEKGSIELEFTQKELTTDSESEKKMLELVNKERVNRGIKPLVWDIDLSQVGRKHSEDMFKRGYFSHYSPEGADVGDRLAEAGIFYSFAGENLALAPDVSRAHIGLMNSQGHKRNILDPAFAKIGIGAIDGGIYGKMFTQVFSN